MLSSVLLRQNPHAVREWHARAALVAEDPLKAIECYSDAVKTVDCAKAAGKPHTLWTAFAEYYETRGDAANARVILAKAVDVDYRTVDDLASVYCWWAEMELRHDCHDAALDVARRGCRSGATRGGVHGHLLTSWRVGWATDQHECVARDPRSSRETILKRDE